MRCCRRTTACRSASCRRSRAWATARLAADAHRLGQDAEVPSVKSILRGEQTSTVFKDTRELAKVTGNMVDAMLSGKTPEVNDTKTYNNGVKVVPSYLLKPVSVDKHPTGSRCWSTAATTRKARSSEQPRHGRGLDRSILEMRGITKTFPGVKALSNVNLAVRAGEIHAVVGENGAGKSTLMKVLSGVYPHGSYTGEIHFEGELRRFKGIADSEKLGIIIIHQELALVPLLSIAENIFLGNEIARGGVIDWFAAYAKTRELLAKVGLKESPTTLVTDLGVGKQQLVEIAKALSKEVKLLILDEPTASLNEKRQRRAADAAAGAEAQGIASILISHKLNEIAKVADSITVLRDGATVETMDCRNQPISEDRIIRGMVGRDMAHRYPQRSRRSATRCSRCATGACTTRCMPTANRSRA
jgi:ABC-type branched-subunit amino acid transport system ATPase component